MKPFFVLFFCQDRFSFSQRGNNTQLLHPIWMTKVPTASIAHRARGSISPTRKQPSIDSAVDCQSRSCLSRFVPVHFNEELMTRVCAVYGGSFYRDNKGN